jgi:hypothetical protein
MEMQASAASALTGVMACASSPHPPPFDSPPVAHTHNEREDEGEQDEGDE